MRAYYFALKQIFLFSDPHQALSAMKSSFNALRLHFIKEHRFCARAKNIQGVMLLSLKRLLQHQTTFYNEIHSQLNVIDLN